MDSNGDLPTETPFTISGSNRSDHWQRGGNAVRPAQVKHAFEQPGFMRVQSNICPACRVSIQYTGEGRFVYGVTSAVGMLVVHRPIPL